MYLRGQTHGDGPFVLTKNKREAHKRTVPVCSKGNRVYTFPYSCAFLLKRFLTSFRPEKQL